MSLRMSIFKRSAPNNSFFVPSQVRSIGKRVKTLKDHTFRGKSCAILPILKVSIRR